MANVSSSNSQEANVPKLKFKRADGSDYEQYKKETVGSLFTYTTRRNTNMECVNVITNSAELGLIPQREFFDKDIAVEENTEKYYVIEQGDFVYNPRKSASAPYGPFNCYKRIDEGIVSPLYTCLKPLFPEYTDFLLWYFASPAWHSYIYHNGAQGGARYDRVGMTKDLMDGIPVNIPEFEEQEKISKFLLLIEHRLELQRKLVDVLKSYKRGALSRLFPKNGSRVPEYRFSGFTGDWEQRKFSELYKRSSERNDGSIGMNKNITVATMQFKDDVSVSTEEYLKTYYTFNVGDIAFEGHQSKEFRFGRFVENDIGDGIVSHIFAVFRPIVEYDLKFWKYAINNERLMQRILARSTKASTMMHDLVTEDFLKEDFLVPIIEEQKKIGSFLNSLDYIITLHQKKVEQYINLKQSMLEKLFI